MKAGQPSRIPTILLYAMGLVFMFTIFFIDMNTPIGMAIGSFYVLVVLYSWLLPGHYASIYVGLACSILLVVGWIYSEPSDSDGRWPGINRTVSLVIIWSGASLVNIAKRSFSALENTRDHLEQKVLERTDELRKSEERAKLIILEISDYAIIFLGVSGNIETWNYGAQHMFGYQENEIIGKQYNLIFTDQDRETNRPVEILEQSLTKNRVQSEGWFTRKDGSNLWGRMTITAVQDKVGQLTGYAVVIYDLTDQHARQLETKNKELEQFAHVVAHDLKAPLGTITSIIEFLKTEYYEILDHHGKKYVDLILDSSNRMIKTVTSMLAFTLEGSSANTSAIDCKGMLESIQSDLTSMITESAATIRIDDLPVVRGYETELRLLFQNLLTNAIKFRKKQVKPNIQISAQQQDGYWKFYVQDNGIGISNENIERIFKPFQRLHSYDEYEGVGIGLAHCKKIAELHNGYIEVDSSTDTGSTFIVSIPVVIDKSPQLADA